MHLIPPGPQAKGELTCQNAEDFQVNIHCCGEGLTCHIDAVACCVYITCVALDADDFCNEGSFKMASTLMEIIVTDDVHENKNAVSTFGNVHGDFPQTQPPASDSAQKHTITYVETLSTFTYQTYLKGGLNQGHPSGQQSWEDSPRIFSKSYANTM